MEQLKKIALVTSAANFERQKNIVNAVSKKLKEIGGCVLYVFTCYGIFIVEDDAVYNRGAATIYELLKKSSFDGCILEGNIGSIDMLREMADIFRKKNIPVVGIHFSIDDLPFYSLDGYSACRQMMQHLIDEHKCTRINLVAGFDNDITTIQAIQAYQDTLKEYGIPFEEDRIVHKLVSVKNGRNSFRIFRERGIDDAQAAICVHDVYAIGMCLEMQENGYSVPEDLRIVTLNYSTNSLAFRPELAGADRGDIVLAEMACEGLFKLMDGEEIPLENYAIGQIHYGQSCGCPIVSSGETDNRFQELILAKVEAGNQISSMMQYNASLEKVESLEELSRNISNMLKGINCQEFLFCLDNRTEKFIVNESDKDIFSKGPVFDDTMIAMTGETKRTGEITNQKFSLEQLVPFEPEECDTLLFYPVHNQEQGYGYMVFVNEFLPVNLYNYRICHESIGSSIENLRRQMILRKSIQQLSELHMRDALTRLYNRFALETFSAKYTEGKNYCLVMLDMDGLKGINDSFGHLAGNHAINITANAIKASVEEKDIVIRYGGDEFMILSYNVDTSYWENVRRIINEKMESEVKLQKIPYRLGISLGYSISSEECPLTLEDSCELADKAMYENKKERYAKLGIHRD